MRQLKWSVENTLAGMVGSSAIVVPIRDQLSNDIDQAGEKYVGGRTPGPFGQAKWSVDAGER